MGGDGLCCANGANNCLGYEWDANSSATYSYVGQALSSYVWSMAALVISPSNSVIYLCNTSSGVVASTQTLANQWQPMGGRMCIGAEEYGPTPWPGYISSAAIFTNSLSATQIETLFSSRRDAGEAFASQPTRLRGPLSRWLCCLHRQRLRHWHAVLPMGGGGGGQRRLYQHLQWREHLRGQQRDSDHHRSRAGERGRLRCGCHRFHRTDGQQPRDLELPELGATRAGRHCHRRGGLARWRLDCLGQR
jgi:hypothetical protein